MTALAPAAPHLKYRLFLCRRFLPIFLTSFLGVMNDNILRSGLVVLIAYAAGRGIELPMRSEILVTLCSALLILPFLLFSSIAGTLADKFEKSRLVALAKLAEILIMLGACYGFATENIYLLMALLFLSGTHTTFYSPIKYSLLPEHLAAPELLAGNGFMASGSYLAILAGMIAGGWLVALPGNIIGMAMLSVAALGLAASLLIPRSAPAHPEAHVDFHIIKSLLSLIGYIRQGDEIIRRCIISLSWFLLMGSVYMAQFPNYAEGVVKGDNEVYIIFLTTFSVGLAIGSLLTDRLLKGKISTRLMPLAALGMSVFTYLMIWATPQPTHEGVIGAAEFLAAAANWPLLLYMVMVAVCGGVYMVPLYAVMQTRADWQYRSRVIAASNLMDALFMVAAAAISALLLAVGMGIMELFFILATLNLGMVVYARRIVA